MEIVQSVVEGEEGVQGVQGISTPDPEDVKVNKYIENVMNLHRPAIFDDILQYNISTIQKILDTLHTLGAEIEIVNITEVDYTDYVNKMILIMKFVRKSACIERLHFPVRNFFNRDMLYLMLKELYDNTSLILLMLYMPVDPIEHLCPEIKKLIMRTRILKVALMFDDNGLHKQFRINQAMYADALSRIPLEERDFCIKSNTKSAAKIS